MKKVMPVLAFVFMILFSSNTVFAQKTYVPIFGLGEERFSNFIRNFCSNVNINIWDEKVEPRQDGGKNYSWYYGNGGNDGKICYMISGSGVDWIMVYPDPYATNDPDSPLLVRGVLELAGVDPKECVKLVDKMIGDIQRLAKANPSAERFEKTYRVQTVSSKRKIELDVHFDDGRDEDRYSDWFRFDAYIE